MRLGCNQKGLIAEKYLEYYAALKGYPCVDAHDTYLAYDKAVRFKRKEWSKVQVKYCGIKRKSAKNPSVDLRKGTNKFYTSSEVDFIFTHDPKTCRSWLIPFKKLRGKSEVVPSSREFREFEVE